ncbi:MAG: helix-turn-helix domain-containing protein [Deltaproteobacteria bacterium]|nr:helix-turn-helix domain-containing protein [Deltaproteobacteria bacterium]
MKRYSILKRVIDGFITLKDAAELLGLSYRQILRIKKRFIQDGIEGLLRKSS